MYVTGNKAVLCKVSDQVLLASYRVETVLVADCLFNELKNEKAENLGCFRRVPEFCIPKSE